MTKPGSTIARAVLGSSSNSQESQVNPNTGVNTNNAIDQKTFRIQAETALRNSKNRGCLIKCGALAGILAVGFAACAEVGNIGKGLLPHGVATEKIKIETALQKVNIAQNTIVLNGSGTSSVDVAMSYYFKFLGNKIDIPFSAENYSAGIKANLDIVSNAGAISLQGVQEKNGQWETVASVNPRLIDVIEPVTAHRSLFNEGLLEQVGNIAGISDNSAELLNAVQSIAEDGFVADCTQKEATAESVASATAELVKYEYAQVAAATKNINPVVSSTLTKLEAQPVLVQYVIPGKTGSSQETFVSPASFHLDTPKQIGNLTINGDFASINIQTSGNNCTLTPPASENMRSISANHDYVLLQQPYNLNG